MKRVKKTKKINRTLINKCECCGALFNGDTCEYCNARYYFEKINNEDKKNKVNISSTCNNNLSSNKITLKISDNKEMDFYVAMCGWEPFDYGSIPTMEIHLISCSEMRDCK